MPLEQAYRTLLISSQLESHATEMNNVTQVKYDKMIKRLHESLDRMESHGTWKMWKCTLNEDLESPPIFHTSEELRNHLTTNHNLNLQPVKPGRPPTPAETALRERMANLLETVADDARQVEEVIKTRDRQRRIPQKKLTEWARQRTITKICTILDHMHHEEQCLFDSCLLPVLRFVNDNIPDGVERQSTSTQIVYADLKLLSTNSLERCEEYLLDRVEGYAAELNKPRDPNDPDDIEDEIDLFTYDQEAAEINVHPKWLQWLERNQIGEDGQPCRVENSKDCRGLVLDWVYGRIVRTMEKARASAKRTLGCESLATAAQQAYEGLVGALAEQQGYENEKKRARELMNGMLQMRKNTAGLPLPPHLPLYQERAAAAAAASGSSASSNGDTPAGQEAGPSTASTGSNENSQPPPPPTHPEINDEQMRTLLRREEVLTNAKIHVLEHEGRTMKINKGRWIDLKIAKGEIGHLDQEIASKSFKAIENAECERQQLTAWMETIDNAYQRISFASCDEVSEDPSAQATASAAAGGDETSAANAAAQAQNSAMEEREEATQARLERTRRKFHESIHPKLCSAEDDVNIFNRIMDHIKEINNKIEVAQAAITHQEQLLTNILCVDPGAEVSHRLILPYLQMRIETAASEHAAKKAAAAEADVLGLDDLEKENKQAAEEAAKKKNEAKKRKQKEGKEQRRLREEEKRRAAEIEARHKAEEEKAARCKDGEGALATASKAVGRKVSLISQTEVRYEGTIHSIDAENGQIALENVMAFGTEGRVAAVDVPPTEKVTQSIFFPAEDIKDLQVLEEPDTAPQPEPSPPTQEEAHPPPTMEDLLAQQASQIVDLKREVRMLSSMVARNCMSPSMVARNCMWCGKTPSEAKYEGTHLRSCKCDAARYCSSECQSNDWRTHKRVCLYHHEKRKKKSSDRWVTHSSDVEKVQNLLGEA
ncbi:protein LSM14 [Pycnococcus provasolii]